MGFSRQEYWNGLPFPSSEDLPNPGIESASPTLQAINAGENVEEGESSYTVGGNVNGCNHYGE